MTSQAFPVDKFLPHLHDASGLTASNDTGKNGSNLTLQVHLICELLYVFPSLQSAPCSSHQINSNRQVARNSNLVINPSKMCEMQVSILWPSLPDRKVVVFNRILTGCSHGTGMCVVGALEKRKSTMHLHPPVSSCRHYTFNRAPLANPPQKVAFAIHRFVCCVCEGVRSMPAVASHLPIGRMQ